MSNEWKGRVIRGGIVVVGAMGLIGAMGGLTGIAVGYPGVVRASVIILAVASCIGAASVIAVNIPSRSRGQTTMPPGPAPSLETPRDTRSGMSRGIQGGRQPSTTSAGSPDSAWSAWQWPRAIMAMTSTDELRSDPNPVN